MDDIDSFLFSDISRGWFAADLVTIREAACILGRVDPTQYPGHRPLPDQAEAMRRVIERAIVLRSLPYFAAWAWDDGDTDPAPVDEINAHTALAEWTTVSVRELAAWCDAKGIEHPFQVQSGNAVAARSLDSYPDELRAAIEAFEAVHRDPAATAKQTPKTALTTWLAEHKPELTNNARERIATIANWQPQGGAPKTPG